MKNYCYKVTKVFLFFFVFVHFCFLSTPIINQDYLDYIDTYHPIAIEMMHKYKIPASIILAQALLESEAGKSQLSNETNNHFGIKCHSDWTGECYHHSDDEQNECFRKYEKINDSFNDYSSFLRKSRYSSLFTLNLNDYIGWANELQRCGYASDKFYACKLIKIIENYKLYNFDKENYIEIGKNTKVIFNAHSNRVLYISYNGLRYILFENGDDFEKIAKDIGIKMNDLIKYNEISQNFRLCQGDIIYIDKKKKKSKIPYFKHIVKYGESMHKISQLHGIRIKNIYKKNMKSFNYIPTEGDTLQLR